MNIGFVGAGKLGLPVALSLESRGHTVQVYDKNPAVGEYIATGEYPFQEDGVPELLRNTGIEVVGSIGEVVAGSEIIFVPIQTPHQPEYEGTKRLPDDRVDFDYTFLKEGLKTIADECREQKVGRTVVVISTCLPGTYERELAPVLSDEVDYVYNPFFIAMGTVIRDFENPEFVLMGYGEETPGVQKLKDLYATVHDRPLLETDITTAEAIKVSYNTFITAKTVLANVWGEICEKVGANVDDLTKAWGMATDRLMTPRYLRAGMGDGGGCHPRDNIALSHLARELALSSNIFEDLMKAREGTEAWHAQLAVEVASEADQPLIVLGRSFKPETNIETGSPALLMKTIIDESGYPAEHVEDLEELPVATYFIGTQHERYKDYAFPEGSTVVDPFGYIENKKGVKILAIGRNNE